jgi:hypothetical protein
MKTRPYPELSRFTDYRPASKRPPESRRRKDQRGTAVIIVLIILSILMLYVASNSRALINMQRELKLLDQKQRQRLESLSRTNVVSAEALRR